MWQQNEQLLGLSGFKRRSLSSRDLRPYDGKKGGGASNDIEHITIKLGVQRPEPGRLFFLKILFLQIFASGPALAEPGGHQIDYFFFVLLFFSFLIFFKILWFLTFFLPLWPNST